VRINTVKGLQLKSESNTPEPDQHQHDHPTSCVIALQYSSTTLLPSALCFRKEKFGERLKNHFNVFFSKIL
jgi:hypothetical protein